MRTAVTYTSINGATNGAWRAEHTGNSTVAEIVIEGMWERRNSALGKRSRLMGKTSTVRTVELWSLASLADVVMDQFVSSDNFKVEFLTPNQWSDDQAGKPVPMPALGGAAAFPLRFLDYLIYGAHPCRAAARWRRAGSHSISRAICHPQAHRRIPPEARTRGDGQERKGSASSQIDHCGNDREPAAR
jgi:hypothetical protein